MSTPTSVLEPRVPSAEPHTVFILPELQPSRLHHLGILILADGNRRCSAGGGYAGGARRVVAVAEHLARRPDVAVMVAGILSPDNITKRGDGFFSALYEEFIQLGVEIETRGALTESRIRMGVSGDLSLLRTRGSRAAALADAIEAVVAMTTEVRDPALRLILGIGYGTDIARELGVDIILRTGMEEPGVLRLSGLESGERIATCAIPTLWPRVEPGEVDAVVDLCKQRTAPRLAAGHGASVIVDLAVALSTMEAGGPVKVTITTDAAPAALSTALDRLFAGQLQDDVTVTVEQVGDETAPMRQWGRRAVARHELRIVRRALRSGVEARSVLAPGQKGPLFVLPGELALGHANVHACGTDTRALVAAIIEAQRFSAAYPPLLGGERTTGLPERPAPVLAPQSTGALDQNQMGDRFAGDVLAWAASVGLIVEGAAWATAAPNYALTAFFIHYRVPTEWDSAGASWPARAELLAKYMLLVAAGDEGIFDRVLPEETPSQRWARIEASARFLQGVAELGRARTCPPRVPGAELLAVIADQWGSLFEQYGSTSDPAAMASFRAGLASLYGASLAEHRPELSAGLCGASATDGARRAEIERRFAAAPQCLAVRARALAGSIAENTSAADELRALLRLAEVRSSVGAGLLFRAAALAAPASSVPEGALAALDAAAELLDYHVRLSNDVSGFLQAPGGDRDPKENTCAILVPQAASGALREAANVHALATCRRVASWLAGEIADHVDRLAARWPSMGTIFRRGAFVGRRVYEVGHFATISRAEMSAIFEEAETALRGPG
jgi:hypothetical protein